MKVSGIIVTKRNEIFFGTDNGLYRYFVDNDSCVYMSGMTDGNARIPNTIKGLIEDSSGFIWIGSWVEGICKYDPLSGRIQSFPRLGNRNSAHTIFEDSKNRIWVGSWGEGLFLLDRDEYGLVHKWHNFRNGDKNSLLDDYVYCINEDINNSNIWIGTRSGLSVLKFDDDKPAFENYKPSKSNNSISYNEVNTIMRDNQNVMWIGSMGGGVNFVNAEHSKFKVNDLEELKDQYSTNSIRSIYKDRADNVWIGLGSYGLFKYDVQKNKYFFFKDLPEFSHITRLPTIN